MKSFLSKFIPSENMRNLIKGMGSTFSICVPAERLENSGFLEGFNKRLKELHKNDGLYREYNYKKPVTIADCWQDTGKLLSWAMNSYENEQSKKDTKK